MPNHLPADVDIVIPLFNKAKTVARAIDSVLAQTHANWSLTVVDDGSTDDSLRVVETYTDSRIVIVSQPNAGPGAARNTGLRLGSAPVVCFLDADDQYMPHFLERLLPLLEGDDAVAAVACDWRTDELSVKTPRICGARRFPGRSHRESKAMVDRMHTSAIVARRTVVEEVGGFYDRDRCTYGEDSWLWLQVLTKFGAVFSPQVLLVFHRADGALGHNRPSPYPLPPAITRRAELVASFDRRQRIALNRYLDWYTAWCGSRAARQGQLRIAAHCLVLRPRAAPGWSTLVAYARLALNLTVSLGSELSRAAHRGLSTMTALRVS